MILQIKNLGKDFESITVLDGINLAITEKQCYCIIGRNGAGKSTLIHIIINLLSADRGQLELFGTTYEENAKLIKKNIGVLPEFNPVIEQFSGYEYLKYVGLIYDMPIELIERRASILSNYFFEDFSQLNKSISKYSKGMKIKIGICAAVIHKPKFLILDEPFENLDPLASNNLVNFINDYRNRGNAILISSHEINYIEKIATHVGVLENKSLLFSGALSSITEKSDRNFDEHISTMLGYIPKSLEDF